RSGRRPRRRPATRARRARAHRTSQDPQFVQLADRLEERAAADGMEERRAHAGELRRAGFAAPPAEGLLVELERAARRAQRVFLVAERARRQQVEEAVLPRLRRVCMVEARGRLEEDALRAAAAHERGHLLDGRNRGPAAADLRDAFEKDRVALALGAAVDDREVAPL